ncbi:MAG: AAA family ATPase [Candidatus Schekmanbacteria bacterium]|nr:AAA family ATPase [Candidatus Schekmanbacteria bacterium]
MYMPLQQRELRVLHEVARERGIDPRLLERLTAMERESRHGINKRLEIAIREHAGSATEAPPRAFLQVGPPSLTATGGDPHEDAVSEAERLITVRLRSLKLSNYALFAATADIALHGDDHRPVCLVEGANGFGKSTLTGAIRYALYGSSAITKDSLRLLHRDSLALVSWSDLAR